MPLLRPLKQKIKDALYRAQTRKRFNEARLLSLRYVEPVAPWLHNFLFEKLKRYVKKRVIRSIFSDGLTEGIDQSRLFKSEAKSGVLPLVSIIVPNYNHESYLRERLESIYGQSYRNFEVILLDDMSSDGSVAILEEYVDKYPQKTRLIVNTTNSGGVFHQWKKGIESARGELVWIAESDDFCSLDLLEKLVPFFDNEGVMLAYAKTIFTQDEKEIWSIEEYLGDIDQEAWSKEFVSCAHTLVNEAWGIKNIVPNASSAIFRNPKGASILDNTLWREMKICGDWVFYLHIIRGGLVAYTPNATNYYRLHNSNTSVTNYAKEIFYKEHEVVASTLLELYKINEQVLRKQSQALQNQWNSYMSDKDDFARVYSIERVKATTFERKPNIMMAAFALAAGGGETLPIKIANMLFHDGYSVTFVSLQQDYENPQIRSMLSPRIPLIRIEKVERLEAIAMGLGIEVIHSHHAWVDLTLLSLLEENKEIGMVVSTHGMYEMMLPNEFLENFNLMKKRVDKVVYTADKNLAPFLKVDSKDLMVKIGNALEACEINPINRNTLGIDEAAFVLCLVSRAIPQKGWEEAIKSVQMARKLCSKDIHLVLIGEGEEYVRLKLSTQESFIHFCGFQSNIRDYFAMSDLGFLPSRFEGESFPLVIIDCLYANRPVLASNVGEIYSMLHDGDLCAGGVFDLEVMQIPLETLAGLIAKFASDEDFYNEALMAIPKIITKYDPRVMIEKYSEVYKEVVTKRAV